MCPKTKEVILKEKLFSANNYAPLPVVLQSGKGCYLQDITGNVYIDFLSAYSALNQGHDNQRIKNALTDQMNKLYLTSRAFYNIYLGPAAQRITELFGYDKVLFSNGGILNYYSRG